MSHLWRSQVTHMKESCHTCECVASHIWKCQFAHTKESCLTYEYIVSHTSLSHMWIHRMSHIWIQPIPLGVTFSKAQSSKLEGLFCHVSMKRDVRALSFELLKQHLKMSPQVGSAIHGMSHIWIHCITQITVSHMNTSYRTDHCHTCEYIVLSHIWIHRMSHIWKCQIVHTKESCHTCEYIGSHKSHIRESNHAREQVMSHIWRNLSHTWRSHVTHMKESSHTHEGVMSHIWRSHVAHMKESFHTYKCLASHKSLDRVTLKAA